MSKVFIPEWKAAKVDYNNHKLFPNTYRFLIVGSSGDGKTVILNRLLVTRLLDYDVIFLNTPSILQKEYQILIEGLNHGLSPGHIIGIYEKQDKVGDPIAAIKQIARIEDLTPTVRVVASSDVTKIPEPEKLAEIALNEFRTIRGRPGRPAGGPDYKPPKTIVIVDDAICFNQKAIDKLFTYGRTYSINVIYLVQDFFASSKQQCRSNVNVWLLYRQSMEELKKIYSKVNKGECTLDEFTRICTTAWDRERGFVLITRDSKGTTYTDGEELIKAIRERQDYYYPPV
jgi:hypothetical protein